MTRTHEREFRWFVAVIAGGFALLWVTRVYYSAVFLPRYHGSFGNAASRLIDVDGWMAFVSSGPGLVLHLATAACFATAAILLFLFYRR